MSSGNQSKSKKTVYKLKASPPTPARLLEVALSPVASRYEISKHNTILAGCGRQLLDAALFAPDGQRKLQGLESEAFRDAGPCAPAQRPDFVPGWRMEARCGSASDDGGARGVT